MSTTNVYREGRIHVLAEQCSTCIFRPDARPVDGARVAGMVRETRDTEGATVPCHQTMPYWPPLNVTDQAICRGWWDRFANRDPILQLAQAMEVIAYDPAPAKEA